MCIRDRVIFGHFSPFVPAHGQPLDHISIFIDKNVNTGCCRNEIYDEKATPGYYPPILLPFPWYFNFGPFLAFFGHFLPFVPACEPPHDPISALIDKNIISGCCCNDIYKERQLLQAIITPAPYQWLDLWNSRRCIELKGVVWGGLGASSFSYSTLLPVIW